MIMLKYIESAYLPLGGDGLMLEEIVSRTPLPADAVSMERENHDVDPGVHVISMPGYMP